MYNNKNTTIFFKKYMNIYQHFSSLRGTSNQLLAYTALFEMLHQTAPLTFLFVAVTGTNFIPFQLSVCLQLHSMFGVCAGQMAMLLTALDRLASISAPML